MVLHFELPFPNSSKCFDTCVVGDGMEIVNCLCVVYFAAVVLPLTLAFLSYEGPVCGKVGSGFNGTAGRCMGDTGRCMGDAGRCMGDAGRWYICDGVPSG